MGLSFMGDGENRCDQARELVILEHAVENTNEAFVTIDENHKVLIFNKAAEKIFGYSRDEVVGRDLGVIMAPSCSRSHHEAVKRYVETRIPTRIGHETDLLATRKNGEIFPASISFSVTEVEGRLFFTGIVRDMTETRALQEKITRSERLAALGQLVAEITHEIKNPLMMIGGFARQLIRSTENENSLHKLNVMAAEVRRLEALLADLLDFYLPKSNAFVSVDLRKILEEIQALIGEECKKKGINLDFEVGESSLFVRGDAQRLKQVFLNLVKNGIEAMEEGGNMAIRATVSGRRVEVTVSDSGSGIPEKNRERIFSPFFTTKSYGTGLGLSVSRRIIEEHEGSSLSVSSAEGRGTTFTVIFPVYREDGEDMQARGRGGHRG